MQGVSHHAYLYRFANPTKSLHPHLITINTYAEDLVPTDQLKFNKLITKIRR